VNALVERIEPLFAGVPVHRIHGDCHLGKPALDAHGASDASTFDDLLVGPAVQDVWLLACRRPTRRGSAKRRLLVEAYGQMRDFDRGRLRLVEPLRALRFVHYATWIAAAVDRTPTFRRTFSPLRPRCKTGRGRAVGCVSRSRRIDQQRI